MKGLLETPLKSGVYEVEDRDGLDVRLRRAGWRVARIDLAYSRRTVESLGRKLDFPAYYGKNLDALNDCLGDIEEPTVLVAHVPHVLDAYGHALWDLLTEWANPSPVVTGDTLRDGGVPFALVRLSTGNA